MTTMAGYSIAARMDRLPITPLHRRATVVIGFGLFFDLYEVFLAGTLSSVLKKQFDLSGTGLTLLLASAFVGMFLGAITLGRMADRLGRRRAFLLSMSIYSVFTLLAAFSPNATMLVICRFFAGIGIGAELPVSDTYLGDILPPKDRGRFTAWAYTLSFLGVPLAGLLGHWLVPLQPLGLDGWRWLFIIGALGAVIIFALRRGLPESPRWLSAVGRDDEADAIVDRFETQARERNLPLPEPAASTPTTQQGGKVSDLFGPGVRSRTLMMAVFQFFQTWGYYGFGTLAPIILAAKGYDIVESLGFLTMTYLGYPIGSLLSIPLIERFERKYLIIAAAGAMAVFGILFGVSSGSTMIVVFGFLYTAVSNIFSNSYHVYQAEIFPTRLRGTATSWTYSLSRLSSALMPFVLLPLFHHTNTAVLFLVVAAAMLLVATVILIFGPRTTGRTLTDVNLVSAN
ncbi:MFS transporter [Gordonia sp. CPCC 205515]|uniref:MFS transporter n=1 Tax=Gordonia sp. CPCC 205515 TaxID=3140791 RepID=UPI003AF35D15